MHIIKEERIRMSSRDTEQAERNVSGTENLAHPVGMMIYGGIEQLKDRTLFALSPRSDGNLCALSSSDGGEHWGPQKPLRGKNEEFITGGDDPSGIIRLSNGEICFLIS